MAFTGKEAEEFPLDTAAEWTANYRNANPGAVKAHFIGRDLINKMLEQDGCMGLRIYYALDEKGNKQLIIVGADKDENDLYNGIIAERTIKCPPYCPKGSPLNE
jgi:hypothetical protein